MNFGMKGIKAATRGQKQIYEENKAVILHYSVTASLSAVSAPEICECGR